MADVQPAIAPTAEQVLPEQSRGTNAAPAEGEGLLTSEMIAEFKRRMETLVTEDDTPVDNLFSAKQQRLLVDSLYASWQHPTFGKRFLADANVGVYYRLEQGAVVVPDCFVSVGVTPIADLWSKAGRSYMVWMYGKPPDVVVEVVSNREGGELGEKLAVYEWMRVLYYVVYDPQRLLVEDGLRVREHREGIPRFARGVDGSGRAGCADVARDVRGRRGGVAALVRCFGERIAHGRGTRRSGGARAGRRSARP